MLPFWITSSSYPEGAPIRWEHGGWRPGAGRKRGRRTTVMHEPRPVHAKRYPSHVTVPVVRSVARSLRKQRVYDALRRIFLVPRVEGFQVVHHSVQDDHVHLVVEAIDGAAFSSGMRSLCIRLALKLNQLFHRRKGKVVRDRYHRRDLFNGRQVRRVLAYVLLNGSKHRDVLPGNLDPFSSATSFDGWRDLHDPEWPHAARDPTPTQPSPIKAWSALLATEWREHGLISPYEAIRWLPPPSR